MTIVYLPDDMPLASVHRLAREHGLVVRWDHERGAFRVEAPSRTPHSNNLAAPAAGDGSTGGWPAVAGLVALDAGAARPNDGGYHD